MNTLINLIIIGAGDAFYEINDLVNDINKVKLKYKIIGILDDNKILHNTYKNGIKVLGGLELAKNLKNVKFIFAIGSVKTQKIRKKIFDSLNIRESDFETLIHPSVRIHNNVKIGIGCIIHEGAFLGVNVILKDFVIVEYLATLINNSECEKFSMIATGAMILRNTIIKESAFIGARSVIGEELTIGKNAIVGMGSIVTKNVMDNQKVYGIAAEKQ